MLHRQLSKRSGNQPAFRRTILNSQISSATERSVLIATVLASGMGFIAGSAVNVILPAIQAELDLNGTQLLWTANMFALLLSALILAGGSLGDHYGRKRVFAVGTFLFGIASAVCGLAGSATVLIAARALQGLGGALMVPGSLALLSATVPPEGRGRMIGLWSTFSTLMFALGPAIGGWLAQWGWWEGMFFLNVPLVAIVLLLIRAVPESRDEMADSQLDWLGAILITIGLGGLTYGFTEAPSRGWSDPLIVFTLIVGTIGLIGFVLAEIFGRHPMVPISLFRSRNFTGSNLLTFLVYASVGIVFFFIPLNLIQIQRYPDSLAGLTNAPFVILIMILSPWAGRLVDRIGPRLPLTVGPAVSAVAIAWLALTGMTAGPSDFWLTYLPGLVLLGVGFGITVAPVTTTAMSSAPDHYAGAASGINNALSRIGSVLAVAFLGALALGAFQTLLLAGTAELEMDASARAALVEAAADLSGARPPAGLAPDVATAVQASINDAFLATFRVVMLVAAGLCLAGMIVVLLLVRNEEQEP